MITRHIERYKCSIQVKLFSKFEKRNCWYLTRWELTCRYEQKHRAEQGITQYYIEKVVNQIKDRIVSWDIQFYKGKLLKDLINTWSTTCLMKKKERTQTLNDDNAY